MSSLLVDSNAYTAFWRNDGRIEELFEFVDRLVFPFITIGELLAGFRIGNREIENRTRLSDMIRSYEAGMLYADRKTPEVYAEIFAELRRKGRPIPTNDIWIAALARQHALPVCSLDSDFEFVENLRLVRSIRDL